MSNKNVTFFFNQTVNNQRWTEEKVLTWIFAEYTGNLQNCSRLPQRIVTYLVCSEWIQSLYFYNNSSFPDPEGAGSQRAGLSCLVIPCLHKRHFSCVLISHLSDRMDMLSFQLQLSTQATTTFTLPV